MTFKLDNVILVGSEKFKIIYVLCHAYVEPNLEKVSSTYIIYWSILLLVSCLNGVVLGA